MFSAALKLASRDVSRIPTFSLSQSGRTLPSFSRFRPCITASAPRYSSTKAQKETPPPKLADHLGKLKPKATTPLRRTASDSLPIRSNPSSTRGNILPVLTLTTAENFDLLRFRAPANARTLIDAWWFPKWRQGEVFVFKNGSFVCWGLNAQDAAQFEVEVLRPIVGLARVPLLVPEVEELEFVTDPEETTRLQGDLIILGHADARHNSTPFLDTASAYPVQTLYSRYAYSQALARSTSLSALEESLDTYLTSMQDLPYILIKTGKPGLGRKALIKKLGELMKFRQNLNLNRENYLDVPDFYWTEPELEAHFISMSTALETEARTAAVNGKIDYAAELQSTLRALLTESSSHYLELVIIALIAVEVVVVFIRDGPELWQMLVEKVTGKKEDHTKESKA
ncbi:hypothetical protein CYLTODRAFT_375882 [Cylindrobasidium torrendii FP15055 ss-10]|uniref:DUF155 domain-containing protein n=1 Tax=Cylindrobasidium torrendii FP15055 ss-10 TaxID=1314674 RepID=A0A0D7BAK1_9AGAR|nr:hypothetical protein CYLTODRAFT_375882 [Cylindrobasidium torrendii FP15055 ss-10]